MANPSDPAGAHNLPRDEVVAPRPWARRRRVVAMSVFGVALGVQLIAWGLPTDQFLIFAWLAGAVVCWNIGRPVSYYLGWARDWGPILGLLVIYGLSRGFAENGRSPHVTELINGDRALFGGELPTLWLQDRLYDPDHVQWFDVLASFVYMSHFVASLAVAVVLWLRRRELWAEFMRRWFFLTAIGLATYFAYPAAPPWWAAERGYIAEEVARHSSRGWSAIGLDRTGAMLARGQAMSNEVAAMPSLHSGFACLIAVFFLFKVSKRWWPLLLAYPASMTFTVMYCGEHYFVDVLAAWVYVAVTMVVVGLGERWWRRRRIRRSLQNAPTSPVAGPAGTAPATAAGTVGAVPAGAGGPAPRAVVTAGTFEGDAPERPVTADARVTS